MKERKLIICRGIQGSGKSTWAKQWCHESPEHRVRFNNDDIRNMLGDYWVPSREKLVTEAKANMITFALIKGYDVVVDNMNLNPKEDAWIRTLCENIEKDTGIHVNIEYKDFLDLSRNVFEEMLPVLILLEKRLSKKLGDVTETLSLVPILRKCLRIRLNTLMEEDQ